MKAIIIYYSRSGNTEQLAKRIQSDIHCDILKIVPEEAYGNYISSCLRVTKERRKPEAPKFITPIPNLKQYDVILLGYPIWMQDLPQFVTEFMKQCNTDGKIVVPFATFGMSGVSWTMKTLQNTFRKSKIKYPFDRGVFKRDDYEEWIGDIKKLIQ